MTAPRDGRQGAPGGRDGRVVPVFAVTGGRTRSAGLDLPVEALVTATDLRSGELDREYRQILDMAARPVSLVEVGAGLGVPVGVARVLVSDLAEAGHLVVHAPPPADAHGRPSPAVLTRLLEGLRAQ